MKNKELIRLAFISVKSHKSQSRNIIQGLALGATFLVIVMYLFFSFFLGSMVQINDNLTVSSFNIKYDNKNYKQDIYSVDYKYLEEIEDLKGVRNSALYQAITFPLSYKRVIGALQYETVDLSPTIVINDSEYELNNLATNSIELYDLSKTNELFSKEEKLFVEDSFNEDVVLAGDPLIEESSILISSEIIDKLGLNYDDAINLNVGFKIKLSKPDCALHNGVAFNDDMIGKEVALFNNFKIKGVFNSKVYKALSRRDGDAPIFILDNKALYDDGIYNSIDLEYKSNNRIIFNYKDDLESINNQVLANNRLFIPFGFQVQFNKHIYMQILQLDSFSSAKALAPVIDSYYNKSYETTNGVIFDTKALTYQNQTFQDIMSFYPFISSISMALLVLGSVILLTAIINLYNTASYSISKRRKFLSMMNAIGMRQSDIQKMYLYEHLIILLKALIYIAIISFVASLTVTLIFNNSIKWYLEYLPIKMSMRLYYYPLALLIVVAFIGTISLGINKLLFVRRNNRYNLSNDN